MSTGEHQYRHYLIQFFFYSLSTWRSLLRRGNTNVSSCYLRLKESKQINNRQRQTTSTNASNEPFNYLSGSRRKLRETSLMRAFLLGTKSEKPKTKTTLQKHGSCKTSP